MGEEYFPPLTADDSLPDLIIVKPEVIPGAVLPGEKIEVKSLLKNLGKTGAGRNYLGYYLSTDKKLDYKDEFLRSNKVDTLAPWEGKWVSREIRIDEDTKPGYYYIIFRADAGYNVKEKHEYNNNFAVPFIVICEKPYASFEVANLSPCLREGVQLINYSTGPQLKYEWDIEPSPYKYVEGGPNSRNPIVRFNVVAHYTIKLTVTNHCGVSTMVQGDIVHPYSTPAPKISINSSNASTCTDTFRFRANVRDAGLEPMLSWRINGIEAGTDMDFETTVLVEGDVVACVVGAEDHCFGTRYESSNEIVIGRDSLDVTFDAFIEVPVDNPPFELFGGNPTGGRYRGPGITDNVFDPSLAGVGTHEIWYVYMLGLCSDSASMMVIVQDTMQPAPPAITAEIQAHDLPASILDDYLEKSDDISVDEIPQGLVVPESTGSEIRIFPNPAEKYLDVTGIAGPAKIAIYDGAARLIYQRNFRAEPNLTIPLDGFGSGVYWMQILHEDGTISVEKVLVK